MTTSTTFRSTFREPEVYQTLIAESRALVLIADWETARFVDASPGALSELGYTMAELSVMTGGDLSQFPREEHRRVSQELITLGSTTVGAVPIRCRNGSIFKMDLRLQKFDVGERTYSATIMSIPKSTHETDARFRIEREDLLESEAFYRGVVTCTGDAVIIRELNTGKCIEANPSACALFGWSTVQFQSVSVGDLLSSPEAGLQDQMYDDLLQTGRCVNADTVLVRRSGATFIADMMQNVFESRGQMLVVMIIRDVSERRAQQEKIERSERLAAVGEVAAGVVHEINNPAAFMLMNTDVAEQQLAAVKTLTENIAMFAETLSDPTQKKALHAILAQAPDIASMQELQRDNRKGIERIQLVTRDLRFFTRAQEPVVIEVDLNDSVQVSIRMLRNELRHHAQLQLALEADLPTIAARRGKLGQVATNLLMNAAQAITEGSASSNHIRVTTRSSDTELIFTVEDSGIGMDAQTLARIFEPFFTTKGPEQGTGLGLALCASIVEAHGGTIDVESTLGVGTMFRVRLPHDTGLSLSNTRSPRAVPLVKGRRILVIDDDLGMVRAYRRMFRSHDATVTSSGTEALDILRTDEDFDVILCDMMMPEVDGPQFFDMLRMRSPHLVERIVFCTGGAFSPRARAFINRIDNEVLEKPLRPSDFSRLLGAPLHPAGVARR